MEDKRKNWLLRDLDDQMEWDEVTPYLVPDQATKYIQREARKPQVTMSRETGKRKIPTALPKKMTIEERLNDPKM